MRELLRYVSEIIRDLETLNLLEKKNVSTKLALTKESRKYVLTVRVTAPADTLDLCLEMFQTCRSRNYDMSVKENNRNNGILSVMFFEP